MRKRVNRIKTQPGQAKPRLTLRLSGPKVNGSTLLCCNLFGLLGLLFELLRKTFSQAMTAVVGGTFLVLLHRIVSLCFSNGFEAERNLLIFQINAQESYQNLLAGFETSQQTLGGCISELRNVNQTIKSIG